MNAVLATIIFLAASPAEVGAGEPPASLNMAKFSMLTKQGTPFGCQVEFRYLTTTGPRVRAVTGSLLALIDAPTSYLLKATLSELGPDGTTWSTKPLSFLGLFIGTTQVAKETASVRPCSDTGTCLSFRDDDAFFTGNVVHPEFDPEIRFSEPGATRDLVLTLGSLPTVPASPPAEPAQRAFGRCVDDLLNKFIREIEAQLKAGQP